MSSETLGERQATRAGDFPLVHAGADARGTLPGTAGADGRTTAANRSGEPLSKTTADWIKRATKVCQAAAGGDLEARILRIDAQGDLGELLHGINHLLDMTDAFVREATAALDHAGQEKFYRRVLPAGLLGSFREAAHAINATTQQMEVKTKALHEAEAQQAALVHTQSQALSEAESREAKLCVEFNEAEQVMARLARSSHEIGSISRVIGTIANQTKLLALNASIETARVGEAGRGFGVVAAQVKELATQTAGATRKIDDQLIAIQSCSRDAVETIHKIKNTIDA